MDALLESIRAAIAADATAEAKAAGAAACRSILSALEPPVSVPALAPGFDPTAVANIVGALRGVAPDQLLDLAIAKLRAALPAGTAVPVAAPLKFHIVPIPRRG